MRRVMLVLCCLAVMPVVSARAQESPFNVSVVGGMTAPLGEARQAMRLGWNVGAAASLELTDRLGVRADYLYTRFGVEHRIFDVTLGPLLPAFMEVDVRAKSQMHTGSFDVTWAWRRPNGSGPYVMAGPSIFRRRVQLTGTGPTGQTSACEPQWLQCQAEPVNFDRALGIRESIDVGFNVGAGVAFHTGLNAQVVIEARYFYVNGPSFHSADGRSVSGSASYLPVSVGLRF